MSSCLRLVTCLLATAGLAALETSLVMSQTGSNGGYVAMANPQLGSLRIYQGGSRKFDLLDANNFYTDLYFYANLPHPQANAYTMLRVGHHTEPSYNQMLDRRQLGSQELANAAIRGENAFWTETPQFDGVARGDFGTNFLFLVVPSYRAGLLYTLKNNRFELTSYRNLGPDFYLPQGLKTNPAPSDLLRGLPREQRENYEKIFEDRKQALADDPDSGLKLEPMDPWVRALTNSLFVVLDPANQRLITYKAQNDSIMLLAARNLEIDLMVPPEASFNTAPSPADQYKAYEREMRQARQIPYTPDELKVLLATTTIEGVQSSHGEPVHADLDNKNNLIIDFTSKHKILYFKPDSGNGSIELYAVRDYSLESGISIHREMIRRSAQGNQAYQAAVAYARNNRQGNMPPTRLSLQLALKYQPTLYEQADKEAIFKRRKLNEESWWQPMMDAAIAAAEKQAAAEEKRKEMLEKMQNQR
jgi:hypothetical protein